MRNTLNPLISILTLKVASIDLITSSDQVELLKVTHIMNFLVSLSIGVIAKNVCRNFIIREELFKLSPAVSHNIKDI